MFTLEASFPLTFRSQRVEVIPPAIDPESPKNFELASTSPSRLLGWIGVEFERPLVTQVCRFDPWKDPPGVIAAYRLVKREVPGFKLALVGSMALDDPEGWEIYRQIQDSASERPGHRSLHQPDRRGQCRGERLPAPLRRRDPEVDPGRLRAGRLRDALEGHPDGGWRAGGIPLQMQGGAGGFLVDSVEECAEKMLRLLHDPEEGEELALWGKEIVREHFLLPRLIADELELYASLLSTGTQPGAAPAPEARP